MNEEAQQQPQQEPQAQGSPQMSEQELRERLAEEMKKIQVRDILLQTVVTLINLGGQRLGLTAETSDARDPDQTRLAIEAVRVLLPLIEESSPGELVPVRDALAQLQVAYAREASGHEGQAQQAAGTAAESGKPAQQPGADSGPQPRESGASGIWVPPGSET